MDKEYICGAPLSKHSKITGDLFYFEGTKFTNIKGQLVDSANRFVCSIHSQFARDNILIGNDDKKGKERYELCKDIIKFFDSNDREDFEIRIEPKVTKMYNNILTMKYNQNAKNPGTP